MSPSSIDQVFTWLSEKAAGDMTPLLKTGHHSPWLPFLPIFPEVLFLPLGQVWIPKAPLTFQTNWFSRPAHQSLKITLLLKHCRSAYRLGELFWRAIRWCFKNLKNGTSAELRSVQLTVRPSSNKRIYRYLWITSVSLHIWKDSMKNGSGKGRQW